MISSRRKTKRRLRQMSRQRCWNRHKGRHRKMRSHRRRSRGARERVGVGKGIVREAGT